MQTIDQASTSRLIQITDCHLGANPGETLLGLDTDESLRDVLELIRQRERHVDMLVASGDIASGAQAGAYQRFLSMVGSYCRAPLAWLAGNHDRDSLMRRASGAAIHMDYLELEHWQIILLNSSVPGYEHGDVSAPELQRLRNCLQSCSKHALVFVHHQPLPVGSAWIDQYVIRNGQQLLQLLAEYDQVKGLVWGHVHQEFSASHGNYRLLSTPSTCIQFKPDSTDFALDNSMPGYRWFELSCDGGFTTGVERVSGKSYAIDFNSAGY